MQTVPIQKAPLLHLLPLRKSFRAVGASAMRFIRKYPLSGFLLGLALLTIAVYQSANHTVSLYIDGEPVLMTRTLNRTVGEVLAELEIELDPNDRVTPERSAVIPQQARIDIMRAFPVVVIADSTISVIWTPINTVEQFLEEKGFELGPYDRVEPDISEELQYMSEIRITRVTKAYATEQSIIPYEEVARGNPQMDRGLTRLISEGRDGLQEETVEIIFEDGREADRQVIATKTIKEALSKVIEVGENTKLQRDGRILSFDRVLVMTATSYCPGTPGSGCPIINDRGHAFCTHSENDGYTFTGKKAVQGEGTLASPRMVAVDPRVIPLGSLLYIEEIPGIGRIGFARAEDIGGAIKENKIDILYDLHKDVAKFGIRFGVKVYVLSNN